ncbi:tripartite motif-containing 13 [Brachionus plicatilis]|uniref:Tripartite motif-containing 13 n=1 Tax=Brachionus plicatilis TaxID=10195 RepID=A0A3M7SSD5_BRAPC|nr:tripartite motif-containing 13 [Brachionus plicatilis]
MLSNQLTLTCPICHKEYESPVILPCGESICSKCANPSGFLSDNFLCKLCNSVHQIPENGFQQNKALIKVIESSKEAVSERKVEKRLRCFLEIEAAWDFLRKSFENCKENIKDSVRQIINDIEIVADLKCNQINQLRDDLIEKVLNYERDCLENYTNYNTEYYEFVNELKPFESNKEKYVKNNFLAAQTIKSQLGIEIQKFKSRISNFEIFSFKKNPIPVDPRTLGFIYEHHIDPIRLSEFIRIDFSQQLDGSSELRQNLRIKNYIMTSYGIDITTYSNSMLYKLVLQVHDFSQCQRCFELELSENQWNYEIEANEGMIALSVGNKLIGFDYNLKEISRTNLVSPTKSILNQIVVVDRDDGSYVKDVKIDQNLDIVRVNNENVMVVFNKDLKVISFLDFDGNRRDERSLDEFPSEKTEIIQGSTLRAIQNNLNRYDDWLCVWREGMWDDECSS